MSNFSTILWWEQVTCSWYDDKDDLRFVQDQLHVELDFYSASSMKQQSAVTIGHTNLFLANQSLLLLLNTVCLAERKQIPMFLSLT
jgi:hypothetical protein